MKLTLAHHRDSLEYWVGARSDRQKLQGGYNALQQPH